MFLRSHNPKKPKEPKNTNKNNSSNNLNESSSSEISTSSENLIQSVTQIKNNTMAEEYKFADIKSLIAETFDGDRSQLASFIQDCKSAINLCNAAQKKLLLPYIVGRIRGSARAHIIDKSFNSFDELSTHLTNAFSDSKDYSQLMEELSCTSQHYNESIEKYHLRIERLQTRIINICALKYPTQTDRITLVREHALVRFMIHCSEDISSALRRSKPQTLQEAYTDAITEERYLKMRKTNRQNIQEKFCKICKKTNHSSNDCYFKNSRQQDNANLNKNIKSCKYCKKTGHSIEECRVLLSKERQNKNHTNSNQSKNSDNRPINRNRFEQKPSTSTSQQYNVEVAEISNDEVDDNSLSTDQIFVNSSKSENTFKVKFNHKTKDNKILTFEFLVDTGAELTLIKLTDKLREARLPVNQKEATTLTGLGAGTSVRSVGTINLETENSNYNVIIKCHIIKDECNLPLDGILGNDFLRKHLAEINLKNNYLKLNTKNFPIIPIEPANLKTNSTNQQTYHILEARSESVIKVNIINQVKEGVCMNDNVCEGVYLAKAILNPSDEQTALTTIINTTNEIKIIPNISIKLEEFTPEHATIFSVNENINQISRSEILRSQLNLEGLNDEEKGSVIEICSRYNDIFYLPNDNLTASDATHHEIKTTTLQPIQNKIYRLPKVHEAAVEKEINKLIRQNIIIPSVSPYNSPLWVVPKKSNGKEKKWRIVVDYRKLNNVTVGDSFPLPNINHILDQLGRAVYFTSLDLASGFHQILMNPDDRHKTAFSTPNGHYEFLRMPFGLKNAPATFQRMMTNILTGLQGSQCFVYLDDIVIYANNIEDHKKKLSTIFNRLRHNNLKLQPEKCIFLRKEITYLGHVISQEGVKPEPNKIISLKNYPKPRNVKEIQQFLGFCGYYRKFIKNFSVIANPLVKLTKKKEEFKWLPEQEQAFQKFKTILTSDSILIYPDFKKTFILTTDACNYAVGAVLSQGEIGSDRPIAYASSKISNAQQNYSTTEKELLAIVWAVKHFRPYLFGQKFKIITDHRPLTWLFNCKDPSSRLVRWRLQLEEYDYEIEYKPGTMNSNADALSRNPIFINKNYQTYENFTEYYYKNKDIPKVEEMKTILTKQKIIAAFMSKDLNAENKLLQSLSAEFDFNSIPQDINLNDAISLQNNTNTLFLLFSHLNYFETPSYKDIFYTLINLKNKLRNNKIKQIHLTNPLHTNLNFKQEIINNMIDYIFSEENIKIILVNKPKLQPSNNAEKIKIIKENHASSIAGHSGIERTYRRLLDNYYWKSMKNDVKEFINSCKECQENKTNRHPIRAPMEITTTCNKPFEVVALDIVGPLPETFNGNKFILTLQDNLTKYFYAEPIINHEAETVAEIFYTFVMLYGFPKSILTDNGSEFKSNLFKQVNKLFKVRQIFATPYHPQTNGALERSHSTLKDYLKHFINSKQDNWDTYIPSAVFCYNTSIHTSTNFTPYELIFGHKASIPNSAIATPEFRYSYDDYHQQLKLRLNTSHEIARNNLITTKEKTKQRYDNRTNNHHFKVGDLVYIKNCGTTKGLAKKLEKAYKGPYEIQDVYQNQTVSIKIKNKNQTFHKNLLKPFVSDNNGDSNEDE